jgi:hypothetical protein
MHNSFSPFEGCRLSVVGGQEAIDGFPDLSGRGKAGPAQSLPRQNAEPYFHLVEPTGMGGGVVPVHVRVASLPTVPLRLMGAEVVENDVNFLPGIIADQLVHEVQEVPASPAVVMTRFDLPGAHIQGCKQRRSAMALVLMVKALEGLPVGKAQVSLRTFQSLNRRLLIHTQNDRMVGRREVDSYQVRRLGGKLRVGRDAPTVSPLQANAVTGQGPPNLPGRDAAQGLGDQTAIPTAITRRGRLIEQSQDAPLHLLAVTPAPACARSILQAPQPLGGETTSPLAYGGGAKTQLLGDGGSGRARCCRQNQLGPQHQTLLGRRGSHPRFQSSSLFRRQFNRGCWSHAPIISYRPFMSLSTSSSTSRRLLTPA